MLDAIGQHLVDFRPQLHKLPHGRPVSVVLGPGTVAHQVSPDLFCRVDESPLNLGLRLGNGILDVSPLQ